MARKGTILVLVLMILSILSLAVLSQMMLCRGETAVASGNQRLYQARSAAMSGIARGLAVLESNPDDSKLWQDNPELFQAQLVTAEGGEEWYFTVYADSIDGKTPRYGIEDEGGKINLNAASPDMLLKLLNGRTDLADALMDYLDADAETRTEGAEQDYYDNLAQPYRIRNGRLSTLEELLLVKGFDGRVVFGNDANRNGLLEKNEDDGEESFPPDNADGQLDTGLRGKATVITYESDKDRVDLNSAPPQDLREAGLSQKTVDYIDAYRKSKAGPAFKDASELIDAKPVVDDQADPAKKITYASDLTATTGNLGTVLDKLTCLGPTRKGQQIRPGRVNLNTAPLSVLMCLPGLTEQSAQQIFDMRDRMDGPAKASPAWVLTQNVIDASAFKKLAPYATARSRQFRIRSFGYCPTNGRFCVLEATVDLAGKQPRLMYLRDLTALGVPMAAQAKGP